MQLPKVTKSRLVDQVVEILYTKISMGELKPGDRLPGEIELSDQLGVGRPTVREALSRLIGLGLVERGDYYVCVAESANSTIRAQLVPLLLEQWEIRELYEARMLIELDLVMLAIRKATPGDIAELRSINEKLIDGSRSTQSYWEIDMLFHAHIAAMSGNEVMRSISNIINDMFKRYEAKIDEMHDIQAITYRDHEELIDAIACKDEVEARTIVQRMLSGSEQALFQLYEDQRKH